ncbi:Nucleolar protein 16 [Wickerhamiella sorbophila]|uniref:Nucleolar protein 16 n=1 Tax=Wickerhamiella sorbophila TaxID=45607 RepID=A0A2T0FCI8_9ASCO|nr:Nucleolar protein 16 [Wickerhamiella sorbophila]PRT52649.1 Nucleolar protein 16 [Wickerhamiella sorbophila]
MPSGIRRRRAAKAGENTKSRRGRKNKKTKSLDVQGNPVIAAHWDKNLTLAQNYKKLGLTAKLQKPAGGVEKDVRVQDEAISQPIKRSTIKEAKIVTKEDGSTEIVYASDDEDEVWTGFNGEHKSEVINELKEYAANGVTKPRHQSDREQEWIEALVAKHGDDYQAMQWDRKVNVFQKSAGDLKRRIFKWKKSQQNV